MSKTCTSWEILNFSTNTSSNMSFSKTDQCPYNVVTISNKFFCAQILYLGFYKFEYNPIDNVYIGQMSNNSTNVYYLKWQDPIWTILDEANATYAETEAGLGCPNDLNWHRVCNCWQHVTCECGDIQTFSMNSPTIRQQNSSECSQSLYGIPEPNKLTREMHRFV